MEKKKKKVKRPPTMTLTFIGVIFNKRGLWCYLLYWELLKVLLPKFNVQEIKRLQSKLKFENSMESNFRLRFIDVIWFPYKI